MLLEDVTSYGTSTGSGAAWPPVFGFSRSRGSRPVAHRSGERLTRAAPRKQPSQPAASAEPSERRAAKSRLKEPLGQKNHPGGSSNPARAARATPGSSGTRLLETPRAPRAREQNQPRRDAADTLTQTRRPTATVLGFPNCCV